MDHDACLFSRMLGHHAVLEAPKVHAHGLERPEGWTEWSLHDIVDPLSYNFGNGSGHAHLGRPMPTE